MIGALMQCRPSWPLCAARLSWQNQFALQVHEYNACQPRPRQHSARAYKYQDRSRDRHHWETQSLRTCIARSGPLVATCHLDCETLSGSSGSLIFELLDLHHRTLVHCITRKCTNQYNHVIKPIKAKDHHRFNIWDFVISSIVCHRDRKPPSNDP